MGLKPSESCSHRQLQGSVTPPTRSPQRSQRAARLEKLSKPPALEGRPGSSVRTPGSLGVLVADAQGIYRSRFSRGQHLRSTAAGRVETDCHSGQETVLAGGVCSHRDPTARSNIRLQPVSQCTARGSPRISKGIPTGLDERGQVGPSNGAGRSAAVEEWRLV